MAGSCLVLRSSHVVPIQWCPSSETWTAAHHLAHMYVVAAILAYVVKIVWQCMFVYGGADCNTHHEDKAVGREVPGTTNRHRTDIAYANRWRLALEQLNYIQMT